VEEPTASKKKKTSQSHKISPTPIPKTKRHQRKDYEKVERSDSAPEETIKFSPEPVSKLEKSHELNIHSKKKFQKKGVPGEQILEEPTTSKKERLVQSKEPSPTSIPKDQLPQSERRKRKKTDQKEVSHDVPKETIEFPQESVNELEKTPGATIVFPQEPNSDLEKTPNMTSGSKGKIKTRKSQKKKILEPTP
jgi:hypothetical protein